MKKISYPTFVFYLLMTSVFRLSSQVVYGTYNNGNETFITIIDLATCTACNVFQLPSTPNFDISILPNGDILLTSSNGPTFSIYTPPSQVPTSYSLNASGPISGSILFNGLVYFYALNGLHYFDPSTNQIVYVGPWPSSMPLVGYEFFELNGEVYAMDVGIDPYEVWLIDLINPANSTLVQTFFLSGDISSVATAGNMTVFVDDDWVYNYDLASNTATQLCSYSQLGILTNIAGLSYLPPGLPPLPCLCETDAGTVMSTLQEVCLPDAVNVFYNGDAILDGDDILQYILFSDLADTLGSILAFSNTSMIDFDPNTMQTGITYYIATIAGNDLNGIIDLSDPCLSVSNASEVIWWPQPSVSFAAPNPDVCVGGCITLEVTLTGTPPFGLTGEVLAGGNVVGTFNENYLQNNGTLNACAPLGTAPGSLSVQAITLSDANCSCL